MTEKEFVAREGQFDFSDVRWCPVINCVLVYQNKFLLVKRSEGMCFYPSYWNGISGFIDDSKSLEDKVMEELNEETGLAKDQVVNIELRGVFSQEDPAINKSWIVHAVKVTVNTDKIILDEEATEYEWLDISEVGERKLLPGLTEVIDLVLNEPNRITRR